MIKINDLKKWNYRDEGWCDENNNVVKVLWSEKEGNRNIEHSIHEDIEKTIIDGIEYTKLRYVYGEGLVITDNSQKYTIKVSALKNENNIQEDSKNENKISNNDSNVKINPIHTCIIKNTVQSIYRFDDSTIIVLDNQKYKVRLKKFENLSDEDMEIRYGNFAIDDDVLRELYSTNYIYDFEKID